MTHRGELSYYNTHWAQAPQLSQPDHTGVETEQEIPIVMERWLARSATRLAIYKVTGVKRIIACYGTRVIIVSSY